MRNSVSMGYLGRVQMLNSNQWSSDSTKTNKTLFIIYLGNEKYDPTLKGIGDWVEYTNIIN